MNVLTEERKGWARLLDESVRRERVLQEELDRVRNLAQGLMLQLELERTLKYHGIHLAA